MAIEPCLEASLMRDTGKSILNSLALFEFLQQSKPFWASVCELFLAATRPPGSVRNKIVRRTRYRSRHGDSDASSGKGGNEIKDSLHGVLERSLMDERVQRK